MERRESRYRTVQIEAAPAGARSRFTASRSPNSVVYRRPVAGVLLRWRDVALPENHQPVKFTFDACKVLAVSDSERLISYRSKRTCWQDCRGKERLSGRSMRKKMAILEIQRFQTAPVLQRSCRNSGQTGEIATQKFQQLAIFKLYANSGGKPDLLTR